LLFPVRTSKREAISDFYFPLGLQNFLISNFAIQNRVIDKFKAGFKTGSKKGNGVDFWCKFANEIIGFHEKLPESIKSLPLNPGQDVELERSWEGIFSKVLIDYPFSVGAQTLDTCLNRKQLFIVYKRRA
jgi:hypothetical protein